MYRTLVFLWILVWTLAACTSGTPFSQSSGTPSPLIIQIRNIGKMDFENVRLSFPGRSDETIVIDTLPANMTSAHFPMTQAFELAQVELVADGQTYVSDPSTSLFASPITSGSFIYFVYVHNGKVVVSIQGGYADREREFEPVVNAFVTANIPVAYEPSVPTPDDIPFNLLWGEAISTEELLQVNKERVRVFIFADTTMAETAAATVQLGGTILQYTRPDGTVARQYHTIGPGNSPVWWHYDRYILLLGDRHAPVAETIALVTRSLGVEPLNTMTPQNNVLVRVYNFSDIDFDDVVIGKVAYGMLPAWQQSVYQVHTEVYDFEHVTVLENGNTYEFIPMDYEGATLLRPATYTYMVSVNRTLPHGDQITTAVLEEGSLVKDAALLGKWELKSTTLPDGIVLVAPYSHPYLEFYDHFDPENPTYLAVDGFGGCNQLFGSYKLSSDNKITLGLAMTLMGCEPEGDAESFLTEGLRQLLYYHIQEDTLTLTTPNRTIFTFTRHYDSSE